MISKVEITTSTFRHAKELSLTLRENDKLEAQAMGLNPVKGCFDVYRRAIWRMTGLIDGKVAAMWGIAGNPLGDVGQVYLITGTEVEKISPLRFARIYKEQVEVMKTIFPILENYVDARYEGAIRLLKIAGFELSGPFEIEPTKALFYKFRIQ